MIFTRQETHDILTDLRRIDRQASPATLRLIRQVEDSHKIMGGHATANFAIRVEHGSESETGRSRETPVTFL